MQSTIRATAFAAAALLSAVPVFAQGVGFELTVANIMRGPEHVGEGPSAVRWSDDGEWVFFRWKPGGRPWHEPTGLYRVRARGGDPERLPDPVADSLAPVLADGPISADGRWRAVSSGGDLYLIDRRSGSVRALTRTRATEVEPVFSRTGNTIYYVSDNNVFALDLVSDRLAQVTDIRTGPVPADPRPAEGQRGFLEQQQLELFEHIRREREQRDSARARTAAQRDRDPLKPAYLERDERVAGLAIEPEGRYVLVSTTRPAEGGRRTLIPDWVTASGYTEPREVRTKVGDAQGQIGRMGVVSVADGSVGWIDLVAAAGAGGQSGNRLLGGTRFLGWNAAGTTGLVGAGSADFKDAWLWAIDAATGRLTLLVHDHDDAWLAGPCAFWSSPSCTGWMPDGQSVYFTSERDGHNHVYVIGADGTGVRQLTSGPWEVHSIELSRDRRRFHLQTSEGSPHEIHFYHMDPASGEHVRVTTLAGRQDATPSPDGARLAFVHSFANQPPELYLADNRAGAQARRITTTPTAQWRSFDWIAPEIVHVPAEDATQVPARIYRPADVGAQPNGAAVIFVHGAGYLQNVHNWWSSYYREYMFHHLLASRGYVVLDIDYRGSAGYGRDWRTAIYRHMGGKDLSDQVDGVRYLQRTFGIDPERVGIYGGSYGGFITLMALFTAPESFGAGAALRSVTDWAHYNHGYTGRILNLPQDDTLAYRQSSPIYFAEGLEDPLLIAHGMVDTNVHFSDVVRLAQRLIELGKTGWEMAIYPVEDHGFVEPSSWTDEYRRILELFDEHLNPPVRADGGGR
jgi:dipeptidyl aminopeptidase/acylaminoacyl peptidase